MNTRRKRRGPMSEINVVPYIDVMLVLLVIFMITTPLLSQGVKVDLPQATAQPLVAKHQEPIVVSIDQQGQYFLNISSTPEKPIDASTLMSEVNAELQKSPQGQGNEPRQVLVKGDQSVDYGKVVQAMVLLQKAGAPGVGLVTDSPEDNKK